MTQLERDDVLTPEEERLVDEYRKHKAEGKLIPEEKAGL